jgi:hypothetical protein
MLNNFQFSWLIVSSNSYDHFYKPFRFLKKNPSLENCLKFQNIEKIKFNWFLIEPIFKDNSHNSIIKKNSNNFWLKNQNQNYLQKHDENAEIQVFWIFKFFFVEIHFQIFPTPLLNVHSSQ